MSAALWTPAYVGIGSNLDDPPVQVAAAFDRLAAIDHCRLVVRSRLYRSTPLGPHDQPQFVNAAAGLLTTLAARQLFNELKRIETELGRAQPIVRWGPRRIDLDLLLLGDLQVAQPDLTIPHAGLTQRNFVLYPLCDIAPGLVVAGHGRISALAARVGSTGLTLLA